MIVTRVFSAALFLAALSAFTGNAIAQSRIAPKYTDVGLTVGIGGIYDAPVSGGFRAERGIATVPRLGNGTLGLQLSADYYTYGFGFLGGRWNFYPVGLTLNYHFASRNDRIDPFVGAGVGYRNTTCTGPIFVWRDCSAHEDGSFVIGRFGSRYFLNRTTALYGETGVGGQARVNAGLMFRVQ